MRRTIFELCAESIDACLAAKSGGADRIELCSGLSEGGMTPSHGMLRAAVQRSGLPVHGLVRARGGDFCYTEAEIAVMREDIVHMKELGAAGVVLGMLTQEGAVDVEGVRALVELARPMQVTFHRAFDAVSVASYPLTAALEEVIATGCDRLLTSGGQSDVVAGAEALAALVQAAQGRIDVAVGGGLRLENAASVARMTGAKHFHGSLRSGQSGAAGTGYVVDGESIRSMVERLQNA